MRKLVIKGGRPLAGEVRVSRSKNACLPILAASLLTDERVELRDVPDLGDVRTMLSLLGSLGVAVEDLGGRSFALDASGVSSFEAAYDLVKTMRASICVLGPLLARFGRARVSFPGGCAIGTRPVDLHLRGLAAMGASVRVAGGHIDARARRLVGTEVRLDFPSVGATENLMMAASLAEGETVIENAAREPEVADLADALRAMGARVGGDGTRTVRVGGARRLRGFRHRPIGDRIEAGTWIMAALATGGEVAVRGFDPGHLGAVVGTLRGMGASIEEEGDGVRVSPGPLGAVRVETAPWPGFPTDLQAQFTALCLRAGGTSVVTETIFENRFMHVGELQRLGADIVLEGRAAVVGRTEALEGAPVMCTDLRASAALVIAGLMSGGTTEILRIYHLERGYEDLFGKLSSLGASVGLVETEPWSDR